MQRWTNQRFVDGAGADNISRQPLKIWWLARAAAEETLQGSPMMPAWLKLFRSHLSSNDRYWLRWHDDFAESAELRRAYSGLYGRFMARALLTSRLGFSRFLSLNRNGLVVPGSITVSRHSKGDIPDWLAWDDSNSKFVLCEAKGSLTANDFLKQGVEPKCVTSGKAQFSRVFSHYNNRMMYPGQWVAATRWSTDRRDGNPASLLWDPPTNDEKFSEEEAAHHRAAMTRAWLDSIAPGLGWRNASDLLSEDRYRQALTIRAEPGPIPEADDWPIVPNAFQAQLSMAPNLPSNPRLLAGSQNPSLPTQIEPASVGTSADVNIDGTKVTELEPHELRNHQSDYVTALVTRFGVRPIRNQGEFESLKREQDRARRLEEPAMLVGIPVKLNLARRMDGATWLDGAGIAKGDDLAVFDLRRIEISQTEKFMV